jgi:hypothetical protein
MLSVAIVASSSNVELGRPLLQKGLRTFLLVVCPGAQAEQRRFE